MANSKKSPSLKRMIYSKFVSPFAEKIIASLVAVYLFLEKKGIF